MPFLAIFRKDRDRDHSRAKTPVPLSPAPASISSPKSSTHSHSRSRPSFASSRSRTSPPPQLADISPASDFDYILPEIDLSGSPAPIAEKVLEDPVKPRRALPFSKRRGSASSGVIIASGATTPVQRPFSEALDIYVRKTDEDRDHDRAADREATDSIALNKNNVSSAPSTPNTRQNTTTTTSHSTTLEDLDSDDDPLIPPPTRASVFGGYAYSDRDVPTRSQSLPDVDRDTKQDEMVRSDHGHARPARPQVHPHQLARGKNKSVDLNSLLASSTSTPAVPASASETPAPAVKPKKDTSRGLFGWRSKSSKETLAAAAPAPITTTTTTDPADSSFSLKSFRHVGPASSLPSSPVAQPSSALGSSTNVNSAGMSANTSSTAVPPAAAPAPATANTPPSSYGRASPRPIPGRAGTNRERVNSTGSEGVMTAGLFRQGARRSNTNLVEDASTSPRSSMAMGVRDRDKRGPPTRTWTDRDGDGSSVSGSDRPTRPPRTVRLPENGGAVSDRGDLGLGHRPQRSLGRSTSAMVGVAGDEPSPFASALSQLGEESALARSGLGQGAARTDYKKFGVRSDSALRSVSAAAVPTRAAPPPKSTMPQTATSPESQSGTIRPGHQAGRPSIQSINVRPEMRGVNSRPVPQPQTSSGATSTASRPSPPSSAPSSQNSVPRATGPGPQGINSSSRPGPQSAQSSPSQTRSSPQTSSNKPRQSTPTAIGRSPIRTTIPTKTNDGPSIKPRASSPIKMPRPPSPAHSNRSGRSVSSSLAKSVPPSPTKSALSSSPSKQILSGSPVLPLKSSMRQPSSPSHSRFTSVDTFRAKSPSAMTRAMSPASGATSRAMSPASSAKPTPRTGYVPPPRQSSLAAPIDSDSDESEPEDVESESELGFGENKEVRALRGRGNGGGSGSGHGHDGLSRERTITQRTAGNGNVSTSGRTSPAKVEEPPRAPARHGVSLFDRPTPRFDKSSSSSLSDRHASSHNNTPGRTRASHSTSAISAAATARNAATLADANRKVSGHVRGASAGTIGRPSHIRSPAEGTDTDEDEDEKSETDSEDNAPLSALAPARRPGSSASSAAAPPMVRRPLVSMAGPSGAPPPRPPRRVPGVGVTRNSSLKGSRSVEDLGRMTMAPGSVVAGRPGPRPFVASPPSSTGDSSSGKAPLTPKDGSEAGGRRVGSSLGPAGDEARRKQRRRSEAKASVELGNVINGPGPVDDDEGERMAARHPQMGPGGMGMMGWNQPLFPHMTGIPTFPASHSMSFGSQFGQSMPFIPPPPPPGASEAYMAAHQQAVIMAKQAYLSAVAQQAVAFATEQWERSSNAGGSVYGGSQMSSMNMMGGPMMSVYANSAYAASAYEGSVIGGGWGSASAYGGGATRSVYGGGARSDYGGGMKGTPAKSPATPSRSRARAQTATAENLAPANRDRSHPMPPSTWNTRRKPGI